MLREKGVWGLLKWKFIKDIIVKEGVLLDTGRSRHLLRFWWKQRYKFLLTILLHVSQQVWWLEATPGETYPLVDTSSTGSRKYSSNPFKHQLEYAFYLNYPFMPIYMILFKNNISANESYISFYKSNDTIELWMTDMESSDHIRQKDIVFAYSKKQDQVG